MNLKIVKIHSDALIPVYAKSGDSGFDLSAIETVTILAGETKLIKTGLGFEVPEGYEMQVRPRSGITLNTKLRVQIGTIDSGYRGEVGVIVDNIGIEDFLIPQNYRIAQGIISQVVRANLIELDELSETERGTGGFGHTGN